MPTSPTDTAGSAPRRPPHASEQAESAAAGEKTAVPAAPAAPAAPTGSPESRQHAIKLIQTAIFVDVLCACTLVGFRPGFISALVKDQADVSSLLARMTATGALTEFLANPVFGRLSDRFGRKPFLIGGLLASGSANALVASRGARATLGTYFFERVVVTTADTVFFTNVRAAMTDLLRGAELTVSASRVAMVAGAAVLCGPIVSQRALLPLFGSKHATYSFNAAALTATAALLATSMPETLPADKRMPMDWARANPFNFTRMLFATPTMFRMMLVSLLQTFIDSRNIVESNFMYMKDQLNFTEGDLSNYVMFGGVKIFMGGAIGKPLMQRFGQLGITTFSNIINLSAQLVGMFATTPLGMYTHVLATGIGERKRDGVETLLTGEAGRLGFGRGETAAGLSNWRSLANIAAPLLFAQSYNWGIAPGRKSPSVIFLVRMVVGALLPELVFRSIRIAERRRMVDQA